MEAVAVHQLTKKYAGKTAVDAISFSINKGEIFGLIGPDGAGKTSIFRMLTTLLLPDGGHASVDGLDIIKDYKQIRNRVGYMPGKFSLYPDLSVEENLNFFAMVFNTTVAENYHLIKEIYVQLEPFKKRRAGKLSGGMKQKLALCCALIHKPTILFLDEPTTGVDPVSRKEFWDMLKKLRDQQISILVSTPYMDEADLCDRIALMQSGKILSVDSPGNIINSYPDELYQIKANDMHMLLKLLRDYQEVKNGYAFGEFAHVSLTGGSSSIDGLKNFLEQKGLTAVQSKKIIPTVEDSFIELLKN